MGLLNSVCDLSLFGEVVLFLGVRNGRDVENAHRTYKHPRLKVINFKSYPNYPGFNLSLRGQLNKALKSIPFDPNGTIFHTRGEILAWHLSSATGHTSDSNIIPDVRGAGLEEIQEFSQVNRLSKAMKMSNYRRALNGLGGFRKVCSVSNSLKTLLTNKYGLCAEKITVIPSLSDAVFEFNPQERKEKRKELGLQDDDIVVVFSSRGGAPWQNDRVLSVLAARNVKVVNLSGNVIPHKNVINRLVDHNEVPSYLSAADIGLIWRENSIVNKVASPVKFSEYVCCGLPVIANDAVDLVREFVTRHSSGFLVNSLNDITIDRLMKLESIDRKAIAKWGKATFGIDTVTDRYIREYSSI